MSTHPFVSDPHFLRFTAERLNEAGIDWRGQNPAHVFLTTLHAKNPQAFEQLVPRFVAAYEQQQQSTAPAPAAPFWDKHLTNEKIVKAWEELPANSEMRAKATDPRFEEFAAAKGVQSTIPGWSPAQFLAATLHAASKVPATRAQYAELAKATGGKFGDATELRWSMSKIGSWRGSEALVSAMNAREKELAEMRGEKPEKEKKVHPDIAEREETRQQMRDDMDLVEKTKRRSDPIDNDMRLAMELSWRKVHGESTDDIEVAPRLAEDLAEERTQADSTRGAIEQMMADIPEPNRG